MTRFKKRENKGARAPGRNDEEAGPQHGWLQAVHSGEPRAPPRGTQQTLPSELWGQPWARAAGMKSGSKTNGVWVTKGDELADYLMF